MISILIKIIGIIIFPIFSIEQAYLFSFVVPVPLLQGPETSHFLLLFPLDASLLCLILCLPLLQKGRGRTGMVVMVWCVCVCARARGLQCINTSSYKTCCWLMCRGFNPFHSLLQFLVINSKQHVLWNTLTDHHFCISKMHFHLEWISLSDSNIGGGYQKCCTNAMYLASLPTTIILNTANCQFLQSQCNHLRFRPIVLSSVVMKRFKRLGNKDTCKIGWMSGRIFRI